MYEYVTYPLYVLLQDVTGGCIGVVTFEAFSSNLKLLTFSFKKSKSAPFPKTQFSQ